MFFYFLYFPIYTNLHPKYCQKLDFQSKTIIIQWNAWKKRFNVACKQIDRKNNWFSQCQRTLSTDYKKEKDKIIRTFTNNYLLLQNIQKLRTNYLYLKKEVLIALCIVIREKWRYFKQKKKIKTNKTSTCF